MTLTTILLATAAFVAGVEIARRHPTNPWRYMRDEIRDAMNRHNDVIIDGEIVDETVEEIIDDVADKTD